MSFQGIHYPAANLSAVPPITLEPIRTLGAAAFNPNGAPLVKLVTLRELKVDSDSALHEAVTFSSDDLLKHPPAPGFSLQSIPWGGTLAAAKVDFLFTDCDRPHTVFLRPPNTVQVQFPADAARVLAWLKKSAFVLDQKLAGAVGIFLLAMAAALAPSLGDGDGDEDDAASERHFHHVSVC